MKRSALIGMLTGLLGEVPVGAETLGYAAETVVDKPKVRVAKVAWSPGAKSPMRRVPIPRVVYFATAAKFEQTYADGRTRMVDHVEGDVDYLDQPDDNAEFSLTNAGNNTIRIVAIFLK